MTTPTPMRPLAALGCLLLLAGAVAAQDPAPGAEGAPEPARATVLAERGQRLLDQEDPIRALVVFRELCAVDPASVAGLVGLGRTHLLLGDAWIALRYAEAAVALDGRDDGARALRVRAHLGARQFREALRQSSEAVGAGFGGVELLAAHASALFRLQNTSEAAEAYRRVLALDADHAEAHLRLGSGLTDPCEVVLDAAFEAGVAAARAGDHAAALAHLRRALAASPGNPVVHRLIGETLFNQRAASSMANSASEYASLDQVLGEPGLDATAVERFMPAFPTLSGARRRVAARSLALFGGFLPELVARSARHDLMGEGERTTDHDSRVGLRGKRTFDGRVWDDVRGIGGLRAATGIEALDEAVQHGFDTLAHEIAHQVHLHAVARSVAAEVRTLYRDALAAGRCLDYYAASNYAEYFGQGVEAFASLGKRPTYESTHGHTRFELMRLDPALHARIASLVSHDPIGPRVDPRERERVLRRAVAVALRAGRPADAVTAAELLPLGPERDLLLARARRALRLATSI